METEVYEILQQRQKALAGDDLTWEQRVEKYGEATAAEQLAPSRAAYDKHKKAAATVMAFRKEHKLLLRLFDARYPFSKGRYD